jgi:hypothetical protein
MRHVEAGQNWGITTAADPGSSPAVKNGWLPVSSGWVINSIGIVTHAGHQLLIAVLSTGAPTENDGISQVQAAARAAAAVATQRRRCVDVRRQRAVGPGGEVVRPAQPRNPGPSARIR